MRRILVSELKEEQPVLYWLHTGSILEMKYQNSLIEAGKENRHVILIVLPKSNTTN
jgi:hypothetical protein